MNKKANNTMSNSEMVAMEKNLSAHGMGLPEMVSEVDRLVFEDDEILVGRWNAKSTRKDRFKATDLHARKLAKKAVYREGKEVFVATHVGKDGIAKGHKVTWHSNYDKGRKAWTKKVRWERPIAEYVTAEAIARYDEWWDDTRMNFDTSIDEVSVGNTILWSKYENIKWCPLQLGMEVTCYGYSRDRDDPSDRYGHPTMDTFLIDEWFMNHLRNWIAEGHLDNAKVVPKYEPTVWEENVYRTPELATTIADATNLPTEWRTLKLEELIRAKLDVTIAEEEAKLASIKLRIAQTKLDIAKMSVELAK